MSEITTEVPAIGLNGVDLILANPDHPEIPVHWQVTGRKEIGTAEALRVVVDYLTEDGTEGCHEFEEPGQQVKVRVPRYQAAQHPMGAAA
jgi:hypothetical protein